MQFAAVIRFLSWADIFGIVRVYFGSHVRRQLLAGKKYCTLPNMCITHDLFRRLKTIDWESEILRDK